MQNLIYRTSSVFWKMIGFLFKNVGHFVPMDKHLVLLGGMGGRFYGDNSAHLYEWLLKNEKEIKPYWVTKNKELVKSLQKSGKPVLYQFSLSFILKLLRAYALCFTNSLKDVAPSGHLIPSRTRVLYLTHDIAPKRSRYARVGHPIDKFQEEQFKLERRVVTDYISTSPFISRCRAEALKVPEEWFEITGLPRNDVLVRRKDDRSKEHLVYEDGSKPDQVILYAPTWRSGRAPVKLFPFEDLEREKLLSFLEENNVMLMLRCHKNDLQYAEVRELIEWMCEGQKHIIDGTHGKYGDINTVLPEVDLLITDYSGLLHDYLLLDRPSILVPYDLEEFERTNGFFYDLREYAPGPMIDNFHNFLKEVESAIKGHEEYENYRKELLKLVHTFADDKSCERVTQLIKSSQKDDGAT